MKVTIFNNDSSIKNIKEIELAIPKQGLSYNDITLFYEIPERFFLDPYIRNDNDFDFMKNRLEFLLKYDYACYSDDSLAFNIPFKKLTTDEEVMPACNSILSETKKSLYLDTVFNEFFRKLLTTLSDSTAEIECYTLYERQIAEKKGVLYLKALQFIKYYKQSLNSTQEEGILAAYLDPFFPYKNINCEFSNTNFLLSVAKALYTTKGLHRNVLFKIIQILNAIRLGDTSMHHANNTLLSYQGGASFQIANDGTRTVNIGKNTEVSYSISECAAVISNEVSLSSEDYDKVISDIRAGYELHKKNNAFLLKEFDADCASQTDKHGKLYKENWIDFKNKTKQGWEAKINSTSTRKRLSPIVCFYRLILKYENGGFFSKEFIQDFMNLCLRNNPFEIAPELFDEMFLMEYINERIALAPELQPKLKDSISAKAHILSFSKDSYASDLYQVSFEENIKEMKLTYGKIYPETILAQICNEYREFISNKEVTKKITNALQDELYTINDGDIDTPSSWGKLYNFIINNVKQEYKNASDADEYPYCYYRFILKNERPTHLIDFGNFSFDELFDIIRHNYGVLRSLMYKMAYVLNYIKIKQGNITMPDEEDYIISVETASPIIQEVLVFLNPICNNTFIDYNKINDTLFRSLFISILSNELFVKDLTDNSSNGFHFNVNFVLNILGVLLRNCNILHNGKGRGGAGISRAFFPQYTDNDNNPYRVYICPFGNRLNYLKKEQLTFIESEVKNFTDIYKANKDKKFI